VLTTNAGVALGHGERPVFFLRAYSIFSYFLGALAAAIAGMLAVRRWLTTISSIDLRAVRWDFLLAVCAFLALSRFIAAESSTIANVSFRCVTGSKKPM
jgi:hypothetical protein